MDVLAQIPNTHFKDESFTDDPRDSNYSEFIDKIIPQHGKRLFEDFSDFSEAAKTRVDKATQDLAGKRCVITNTPDTYSVQYAHLLPRAANADLVNFHTPRLCFLPI